MSRSRRTRRAGLQQPILYLVVAALCTIAYVAFAGETDDASGMLSGSAWDTLQRGGSVMYVILLASAVGLGFIFEVSYVTRRSVILPAETEKRLVDGMSSEEIKQIVDSDETSRVNLILAAGYRWRRESHDQIATAIEEIVDESIWQLKRSTRPIGIIANTAPLLGLLGTVAGIIEAFSVVAEQGALGDPGALAGGISKALLTTCFGLIVAIPMLLSYHYFTGRIDNLIRRCEILAKQNLIIPPDH
ncbi:MAG: MotA/TolQ/ExbB proton channel family protein [Verrucomicrobia bacterium]|nr:MotA/TolQ/ExbB proton channel family protein [Verrucomicrobiota bacterium]MDA1086161.1 MotA/TolQ/ExbB proton channel family protein [Verrucomicrobiota bacterium]